MHSAVAEWILSLVTPQAQAVSIVGDLIESSGPTGRSRFWRGVIQTACALLWRDLRTDPVDTVFHAFLGLFERWFIAGVAGAAVVTVGILVKSSLTPTASTISFPAWGYLLLAIAAETILPFYIGWRTARRCENRELASALYMIALIFCFHALSNWLSALQVQRIGIPIPGREYALLGCISESLFVLAGAICSRKVGAASPAAAVRNGSTP